MRELLIAALFLVGEFAWAGPGACLRSSSVQEKIEIGQEDGVMETFPRKLPEKGEHVRETLEVPDTFVRKKKKLEFTGEVETEAVIEKVRGVSVKAALSRLMKRMSQERSEAALFLGEPSGNAKFPARFSEKLGFRVIETTQRKDVRRIWIQGKGGKPDEPTSVITRYYKSYLGHSKNAPRETDRLAKNYTMKNKVGQIAAGVESRHKFSTDMNGIAGSLSNMYQMTKSWLSHRQWKYADHFFLKWEGKTVTERSGVGVFQKGSDGVIREVGFLSVDVNVHWKNDRGRAARKEYDSKISIEIELFGSGHSPRQIERLEQLRVEAAWSLQI